MSVVLFFYTLTAALFIIIELVPLFRQKKWMAFWTYLILISFSYINEILINLDIKIPSPNIIINKLLVFIFRLKE